MAGENPTNAQGEGTSPAAEQQPLFLLRFYKSFGDLVSPGLVIALVGLLLIAIVGIFGGWNRATASVADELPTAKINEEVEVTPLKVSAVGVVSTEDSVEPFYVDDGFRYLIVVLTLTNTSKDPLPQSIFTDQITLDVDGLRSVPGKDGDIILAPSVARAIDSQRQPNLQPGLSTKLMLGWQQSLSEPAPKEVTVTLSSLTWRMSGYATGEGWFDPEPAYQVVMPVKEYHEPK